MKISENTKHNLYALAVFLLFLLAGSVDSILKGWGI